MRNLASFAIAAFLVGCSGSSDTGLFTAPDAAPDKDGSVDAGKDPLDSGKKKGDPVACGGSTCTGDELCITPCCGGVAPSCAPLPAGGDCPSGFSPVAWCNSLGGPGCQQDECSAEPPYCGTTLPDGCTKGADGTVTCVCA